MLDDLAPYSNDDIVVVADSGAGLMGSLLKNLGLLASFRDNLGVDVAITRCAVKHRPSGR
jgi:hypothetical protein